MRESKASTPLYPPVIGGVVNRIINHSFSLDEHKAKMAQIWSDYEKYRSVLGDLNRRVEMLEDILKEETPAEW